MPEATWIDFNMRPIHPTQGSNPVTRTLNMEKHSDGAWHTRQSFGGPLIGISGTIQNHTVVELQGVSYFVAKVGAEIKFSSNTGVSGTIVDGAEVCLGNCDAHPTERGSFAMYNGELYYSDSYTSFAWDGNVDGTARRPGVVSMEGKKYNRSLGATGFGFGGGGLNNDGYYYPPTWVLKNPTSPTDADPYIRGAAAVAIPAGTVANSEYDGEKTLNTGFCFSYWDPKRRTFGRRSEVFALPFVFGPYDADSSNTILTDERTQYAKLINIPDVPTGHSEYKVAIWFTLGQNILTNHITSRQGFFWWNNEWAPYMSPRMTGTLFLEKIVDPNGRAVPCTKDNAALFESGRYISVYDRPMPAKFMAILPNGTAIYFYPWTGELSGSASLGNYAEFSIRHPEQVGRDTGTQRDTISAIPGLRGDPVAVLSSDRYQILLTKHGVYQIGFDGGVRLHEVAGGRGVRAMQSIATSTQGAFWFADEGVVWMRGGSLALLDKKLGFGDWFDDLPIDDAKAVAIGVADHKNQIMVFVKHDGKHRIMVYDYELKSVSEFMIGSGATAVTYAANFRSDTGSDLWAFPSVGGYPDGGYSGITSSVTAWLNDGVERPKTLGDVVLDVDPTRGNITVRVDAYRSGESTESTATNITSNRTHTFTDTAPGRFIITDFRKMRGKLFKITVTGPSGKKWSITRVHAEFEYDESSDARSV